MGSSTVARAATSVAGIAGGTAGSTASNSMGSLVSSLSPSVAHAGAPRPATSVLLDALDAGAPNEGAKSREGSGAVFMRQSEATLSRPSAS